MKRKTIKFKSTMTHLDLPRPYSASRLMPEWYRKMLNYKDHQMTVKRCVPFLDALTAGYILELPADMIWDKESGRFVTQSKIAINSDHYPFQTEDVPLPPEYAPEPHKWNNQWFIQTPPGYSTLFIHPLSRLDLPFYSFSGVVDTDKHPTAINFPFVLRKDFEGVIPAGTPIIQAIPFKRDDWNAKIVDEGESYRYDKDYEAVSPPFGWYKKNWWTRKVYSQDLPEGFPKPHESRPTTDS
jgi:hypothetical protein